MVIVLLYFSWKYLTQHLLETLLLYVPQWHNDKLITIFILFRGENLQNSPVSQ